MRSRVGGILVLWRASGKAALNKQTSSFGLTQQARSSPRSLSVLSSAVEKNDRRSSIRSNANGLDDVPKYEHRPCPRLNLSLFGPPGSGKGSYGKHFAKALDIPLVTTSDVLRKLRPDLVEQMSDGKLVDDGVVGETVLEGLKELVGESGSANSCSGYILDGFPRTLQQVALMEETWPKSLRANTVVHLRVPDFVCSTKLQGRRACSKCGKSYNVHGVDQEGWNMPPHLPQEGNLCESSLSLSSLPLSTPTTKEDRSCDWSVKRDDDSPEIVGERLRIYHQNADPILDYIRSNNNGNSSSSSNNNNNNVKNKNTEKNHCYRLLTLTPYHGFNDLPGLVEKLRRHVGMSEEEEAIL